ncbi:MAG: dicarboxylate/amino acid:cation symporter [Rhabdochlamydiaceae bacterium]|nr:dicarboxylate/amino acid:cation symporter [Rhabdochlamydiaceae bacterium]
MNKQLRSYLILSISILLGIGTGFSNQQVLIKTAEVISTLFLNFLSMIAAPIVLLSILSTLINMRGLEQMKSLGKRIISYTLITTTLASLVALAFFLILDPVSVAQKGSESATEIQQQPYLHFIEEIIPSNIFKAFAENKVISIAFLGFLFGITPHFLPEEHRNTLQKGFSALFQLFLKIAGIVPRLMPFAIWAFMTLLVQELQNQSGDTSSLWIYLISIVSANLAQGVIVIPLLLKLRGVSPWRIAKGGFKALLMAFFTKSSNATLPITLNVAKEELGIRPEVANFTLPLCTVINMNGCAAFILTTVLFVAGINGHVFSPLDLTFWVFLSVLAAFGNAGVPMGCFFLSSAFLISMNVPLTTMGLILPFYALIDMEETALNVWSDLSVAAIVDRESIKAENFEKPLVSEL